MGIYTRKGDKGYTTLSEGEKVAKSHQKINAFGEVDELNSWLGIVLALPVSRHRAKILYNVQDQLFVIGSILACDDYSRLPNFIPDFEERIIHRLEQEIDNWEDILPKQKHFILPSGSLEIAQIHVARTVCRRVERTLVALCERENFHPDILSLINRLSDYLFLLARVVAHETDIEEVIWRGRS